MKILAVYVGSSATSQRNLQHGLKAGIWGFKEHSKPINFEGAISAGDVIILATGHTGGGPRTSAEDWAKHSLKSISYAVITQPPFKSMQPEWPDEADLDERDRYLWRVKFNPASLKTISNVRLDDREKLSGVLAEELRKSGAANGRGYVLEASHFPQVHGATNTAQFNLKLSPLQMQRLWDRFHQRIPGFTDFPNPGSIFIREETAYKRRLLAKFQESLGRQRLTALVDTAEGRRALQDIKRCLASNIVNFHAWNATLGESDPVICDVLREYLKATASPYEGPATTRGIFEACERHGVKPSWDALSTLLWVLRPQDFFPIKISYYRELGTELEHELPDGRPDADALHDVIKFGRAFRHALEPQKPADWVDVQSFIWCVCPRSSEKPATSAAVVMPTKVDTAIYLETTKSSHFHGGAGWEFGTCLWSPSARVDGVDEYAIMRDVRPGDLIIHCEDSHIKGYSFAADSYRELQDEPPKPGVWAKRNGYKSYYRIDVRNFTPLPKPLKLSEFINTNKEAIRKEIDGNHPRHYPFTTWGDFPEVSQSWAVT